MDEVGVSYADIVADNAEGIVELYDLNQGARIKKFEVTDKVASDFFMMFCRGRNGEYEHNRSLKTYEYRESISPTF